MLLFPSMVKFNHIFENHKHDVCIDNSVDHLHELDLDCEFYKFNTPNQHLAESFNDFFVLKLERLSTNSSYYNYLNSHQQLSFKLRGPPSTLI